MNKHLIKFIEIIKRVGLIFALKTSFEKIFPNIFRKSGDNKSYIELFRNKKGIEIGGPSEIFKFEIPIYKVINDLDGCNYSNKTIWEGELFEGNNYKYFSDKIGYQYIKEASNLENIQDEAYDFVIASHCLEHCANPLLTIEEWLRVVKNGGFILLVLPNKNFTFDYDRNITSFNHILEDYKNKIKEDDLTHLEEILQLHNLKMDTGSGTKDEFKERCLKNFENRCLHHHVFDFDLLSDIFNYFNVEEITREFIYPYHQVILGKKQEK